jgi:uncharacterized delta-60 repeat protein
MNLRQRPFAALQTAAFLVSASVALHAETPMQWFNRMDVNGDGQLTYAEVPSPEFATYDANSDGVVTQAEFSSYLNAQAFAQLDTNGDGLISQEEFNALYNNATVYFADREEGAQPIDGQLAIDPRLQRENPLRLAFTKDFFPGMTDPGGRIVTATEANHMAAHNGALFVSFGATYKNPPTPDPDFQGYAVVRKETASSPWTVDLDLGPTPFRVENMASVSFTTDHTGAPLSPPVSRLIVARWSQNRTVLVRDDSVVPPAGGLGTWVESTVMAGAPLPTGGIFTARSIRGYKDKVTGIHHVFAGAWVGSSANIGSYTSAIFRGACNPTAGGGGVVWNPIPELQGTGRVMAFAECNDQLYAACVILNDQPNSGGIFRRIDGPSPTWELVYRWTDYELNVWDDEQRMMRGLTAVPDPNTPGKQVLIGFRFYPTPILEKIDPQQNHAASVELDLRAYFGQQWLGGGRFSGTIRCAYNPMTPVTDPATGQTVHLAGLQIYHPGFPNSPHNGSHFLLRRPNGTYEWGEINDPAHPVPVGQSLDATRRILVSPFPEHQGQVLYFGGYDGPYMQNASAWIYKATIGAGASLSTPFASVVNVARNPDAAALAQPLLGSVGAAVFGTFPPTTSNGGTLALQAAAQWQHRHNGPGNGTDYGLSLSLGSGGQLYVGGRTLAANTDATALRHDPASGTPQWVRTANGPGNGLDTITATAITPDGGLVGIGTTVGPAGTGTSDLGIWKWSTDGTLAWSYRYNGPGNGADAGRAIAARSDGSVAFAGASPGSGTGASDAIFGVLNADGTLAWLERYDGPISNDDQANGVCTDSAGNVYVTGFHHITGPNRDLLLFKYDATGTLVWQATHDSGSGRADWGVNVALDPSGDLYVGGYGNFSTSGTADLLTLRFGANGTKKWSALYNGTGSGNDIHRALVVLPEGGCAVAGNSPGSGTGEDWVIVRYGAYGSRSWAARLTGTSTTGNDICYGLAVDQAGNLYAAGNLVNTGSGNDYTIARFNRDGTLAWQWEYNGPGNGDDTAQSLRVNTAGEVFATGWSTSSTGTDIFTVKLAQTLRYTPPSEFTGLDTFSLTLSDDQGRVVNARVQTSLWPAPIVAMHTALAPGGPLVLTLNGGPTLTYILECSDDLSPASWTTIGTYTLTTPVTDFEIPIPSGVSRRFYRFRFVP